MEPAGYAERAIDFFQSVRLLERELWSGHDQQLSASKTEGGLGEWGDYADEPIRFRPANSLSNPEQSVSAIRSESSDVSHPAWLIDVTFMGLIGPMGVLPTHVTSWLLGEGELARPALRDFLAVFEHRFIARFYRAFEHSRYLFGYERSVRQDHDENTHGQTIAIRALAGFADPGQSAHLNFSSRLPAYYSGLLSNLARPAENLARIISEVFAVPCFLVEFVAEWQSIPRSQQTSLRHTYEKGAKQDRWNSRLGVTACVGSRVWTAQDRFRIQLGPLDYPTFSKFLPAGRFFAPLRELIKLYASTELAFDIQLILRADEVPKAQLGARDDGGTRLGCNSWLGLQPHTRPAADALFSGNA